jgi:DNA-binding PucR family transcriptional regulator
MALGAHEALAADELLRGSWRLLLHVAARDPHEIDALLDATIGPALAPDVSQRADLLHTLRAYLDNDARMSATALAIHAHRHTIAYRLGRIAEVTGHDPQTPAGQSQLTLGLQALTLRTVTTGETHT